MIVPALFLEPYALIVIVGVVALSVILVTFVCIFLYVRRTHDNQQSRAALAQKRLIYSSPESLTTTIKTNRFSVPLPKLLNTSPTGTTSGEQPPKIIREKLPQFSIAEAPPSYHTFDLAKRWQRHLSSDSSYTSSSHRRSQPPFSFDTVKSKFQQVHAQRRSSPLPSPYKPLTTVNSDHIPPESSARSSDSDEHDDESLAPAASSLEYSIAELFRIELVYKLHYSIDDHQLWFQLVRLTPAQSMVERCFRSFICKIRLFTDNDKRKNKKYFSKKDPINELFKFDLDQYGLEQSYLKLHVLGHQKSEKRIELGQTVIVLNQYDNLMLRTGHYHDEGLAGSEQHTKFIQIYEDRIDMITQQQAMLENEARALICLVYENDRCLLHVGLIKIIGLQSLLKQPIGHSHNRDLIQIKIHTIIDGKVTAKQKSKPTPIEKSVYTFSTSFQFDYLNLHKTSIRILVCSRRTLVGSSSKPLSSIEFGSNQVKNQQIFQHWTDTLSAPNRPHVHWHVLEPSTEIQK